MNEQPSLPYDIILSSARDQRTFDYLVARCGLERVIHAREHLPGRSKPFVSNIAKMLGVDIPDEVVITPREEGRKHLSALKVILASKVCK